MAETTNPLKQQLTTAHQSVMHMQRPQINTGWQCMPRYKIKVKAPDPAVGPQHMQPTRKALYCTTTCGAAPCSECCCTWAGASASCTSLPATWPAPLSDDATDAGSSKSAAASCCTATSPSALGDLNPHPLSRHHHLLETLAPLLA